jgi:glutaminyl-peptide cyclotransferase
LRFVSFSNFNRMRPLLLLVLCIGLSFSACKDDPKTTAADVSTPTPEARPEPVAIPQFDAASAFQFVEKQLAFGTREPGSPGHDACRQWMVDQLGDFGMEVIEQTFKAKMLNGNTYQATNVIGRYNPAHPRRILLSAHWDTRAIADYDPDEALRQKPFAGADDGASGVAVLMEIARLLQEYPIDIGVDIVLFDAEDQGVDSGRDPLSWCQGAQHWGRNPHVAGYKAQFGIHLDMVGARNPRFAKEGYSRQYAPQILDKVWALAQGMGYGMFFVNDTAPPVTDDHYFINEYARIPTINIINKPLGSSTGFGPHWHTHGDDLDIIDPRTLKAVGQVVTAVIYNTYMGRF